MARIFAPPPHWSEEDLRNARDEAERRFTQQRRDEGPRAFAEVFDELLPKVVALLEMTGDLTTLSGQVFLDDPDAWQAARYVCGPPISQEDLWTLVGKKFKRVPAAYADDTAEALSLVIDGVRFPWILEGRNATEPERRQAILATGCLWAAQLLGTRRRHQAASAQEVATAGALAAAGLSFDADRSKIEILDDLPRGHFSRERVIVTSKCDVPTRLNDGRLLALECKVSNGPKNGWKRINREVGGKANGWRVAFGSQLITAVVVAGVFDYSCLASAQEAGVVLFFEHDLRALTEFVAATG